MQTVLLKKDVRHGLTAKTINVSGVNLHRYKENARLPLNRLRKAMQTVSCQREMNFI